jgi:dTDP-4-amino-4,6-dideoxygalactose transaminase
VIRHARRDALAADLKARGVQTGLHYPLPLHLQPAFREHGWSAGSFPHAEMACREVLSLPMFPEITAEEIETVAKAIEHSLVTAKRG